MAPPFNGGFPLGPYLTAPAHHPPTIHTLATNSACTCHHSEKLPTSVTRYRHIRRSPQHKYHVQKEHDEVTLFQHTCMIIRMTPLRQRTIQHKCQAGIKPRCAQALREFKTRFLPLDNFSATHKAKEAPRVTSSNRGHFQRGDACLPAEVNGNVNM